MAFGQSLMLLTMPDLFLRRSRRTAASSLVWRFILDLRMSGHMVELALLHICRCVS